ncbi:epoxide hydrolase family protein [Candidatus Pelagibacter sp. HIMB1321]|uniref:epoxide hydrolase family protein n=1 Tax=Candidatus Pelagibacter sp. HIMB1321 TaxID=1388755 RepID=UPI000A080B23|nr:epoxide hydrolase family protein [Candidatus Pelagibacter sp. HIMB1321]SMF76954.1 epoxide hydrolase [Candidatus Pelagibacter sp. HIMB1321]
MIEEFKVNFAQEEVSKIYKKIKDYPWDSIKNLDGWEHGTNKNYLKELCDYWITKFDWNKHQSEINRYNNYTTDIDGMKIHFIKKKGSSKNSRPLLLMHGWPGSIIEFLHIIEKLTDPEKFGGNQKDSFDVIAPSLPGFGFSKNLSKPIGPRKMAEILNKLMVKNLGYKGYLAQGGDWGATIANWLGYDHSNFCKAIHINCLTMRHPDGPENDEERNWQKKFDKDQIMQDGYRTQQATKPQSLAYGMMDSPVGIASWIIEKMYSWSDLKDNDIESVYTKDTLIANIMVYILTKTFDTASWIYFGRREEGGRFFPKDFKKIEIPTAAAIFPAEMSEWPPKSYVEKIFNIQQWTEMPAGGHFAALEKPDLLVEDIRKFSRNLKF